MTSPPLRLPAESEFTFEFSRHLGPRFSAASVTIQTHVSGSLVVRALGDASASQYADDVLAGVRSALVTLGCGNVRVEIKGIKAHDIDSSPDSMYRCGYATIMAMAYCACVPTRDA